MRRVLIGFIAAVLCLGITVGIAAFSAFVLPGLSDEASLSVGLLAYDAESAACIGGSAVPDTAVVRSGSDMADSGDGYVLNTASGKIHRPDCGSVSRIAGENKAFTMDYAGAAADGYVPCSSCLGNME
ncbi:MAG: hypothetical protein E7658_02905 [Ruminococcaceae bacterium]|nr:hypothetical protein [Oscillospiraceae bacterium]